MIGRQFAKRKEGNAGDLDYHELWAAVKSLTTPAGSAMLRSGTGMHASVFGISAMPRYPARGRDRPNDARRSTTLTDTDLTDWENAPWHDPPRCLPASGPT